MKVQGSFSKYQSQISVCPNSIPSFPPHYSNYPHYDDLYILEGTHAPILEPNHNSPPKLEAHTNYAIYYEKEYFQKLYSQTLNPSPPETFNLFKHQELNLELPCDYNGELDSQDRILIATINLKFTGKHLINLSLPRYNQIASPSILIKRNRSKFIHIIDGRYPSISKLFTKNSNKTEQMYVYLYGLLRCNSEDKIKINLGIL